MALDLNYIFLVIGLLIPLYYFLKWSNNFFDGTDVKYILPPFPYCGSNFKMFLGIEHMTDFVRNAYNTYPDEKYIGLFEPARPLIMLRDVNLIKQIGIKEFDSFHDHRSLVDEKVDPLFGRNLFSLKGNVWREMRATLSPAFSSSKMRNMFIYIEECAREMVNFYIKECEKLDGKSMEIEVKDTFSRYTVDVIATSAFGIKTNSLEDRNNEFFRLGKAANTFTLKQMLGMILFMLFPKITKYLNMPIARPEVSSFFKDLVHKTMRSREENKVIRHDMIHLLMEAKKGTLKHEVDTKDSTETGFATVEESSVGKQIVKTKWQDDDFAAQALIFFIGGYDTTSTALTFFFYEVSKQPEIMKKLQEEVDSFISESGSDKFVYNDLSKLKYLDMCLSETLRMWPPAAAVDRICSKSFTLPPPNDTSTKTYEVKENVAVWLPIYGLHHDEKYFPNPLQFDPERFSDENKSSIDPATYFPFGMGPRNCIGSRYALIVVKAVIFHMIANFDVTLSKRTDNPIKLLNSPFNLHTKNGVWINIKPRQRNNSKS